MLKKLLVLVSTVALLFAVTPANAFLDDNSTNAGAEAGASVEQNYGDSYSRIGMPISPQMSYPGLPSYFGPATNQPNYMKVEVITMFKKNFTRKEVEALLSSHNGLSRLRARTNIFTGTIPKDERQQDDSVLVRLVKPEGNFAPVGFITIQSKTSKRDSVDVFFAALMTALNTLEVEEVLLVGEGARNVLDTWGAGIGFQYTQAFLNDGNNSGDASGGSGTGGTGISWGEAGYVAKPYMQLILLNNLDVKTRHVVK